jgi:hypothetical protein
MDRGIGKLDCALEAKLLVAPSSVELLHQCWTAHLVQLCGLHESLRDLPYHPSHPSHPYVLCRHYSEIRPRFSPWIDLSESIDGSSLCCIFVPSVWRFHTELPVILGNSESNSVGLARGAHLDNFANGLPHCSMYNPEDLPRICEVFSHVYARIVFVAYSWLPLGGVWSNTATLISKGPKVSLITTSTLKLGTYVVDLSSVPCEST